jgi:voltage-gated potassium channel
MTSRAIRYLRSRMIRRRVHELLDDGTNLPAGVMIHRLLIILVIASVIAVVLESVPALAKTYGVLFTLIELVAIMAFTVEFVARLWSATEHPPWRALAPWQARWHYIRSPGAIIDLLTILPFYLAFILPDDLKVLVLFRLIRFFKLARYSPGMSSLLDAVYGERRALGACFVIMIGLVLIAASLMHIIEGHIQPDRLGSIPDAMYWAVITLGTVGYGDVVPLTALGKLLASVTALFGLAMFALPVGIIATAFAQAIQRREFVVTWSMVARVPIFADLGAGAIADIMRYLQSHAAEAGEVIIRRGEIAHTMFFIASGEVELHLGERSERLGEGQFFGEIAVLHETRRTTTVQALTRVKLLGLDAADLHRLMERQPEIAHAISHMANKRLAAMAHDGADFDLAEKP